MQQDYPILEFDAATEAILEPKRIIKAIDIPEHAVACFFQDVITQLSQRHTTRVIKHLRSEIGTHPIYEVDIDGKRLAVFHPGIGGPLAGGMLEEVIALGSKKFIACGGAGVLDGTLAVGHIVVPTAAVRDEGTSYHYLPPGREAHASPEALAAIVQRRRSEGCLTVEMEAASFFAIAQFRHVLFGKLLYSGDDVSSEKWDSRHWVQHTSVREKLFWLAAEACLAL